MPEHPPLVLPEPGEPLERQKRGSGSGAANAGKAVPLCECGFAGSHADRGDVWIAGIGDSAEHTVFAEPQAEDGEALCIWDGPVRRGKYGDPRVYSRWMLTGVAWLLRSIGSGVVWPLAIAPVGQNQ